MSEVRKQGRPTIYTDELGKEICLKIATSSKGIQRLCKENPHWPCFQTIYEWRLNQEGFGERYIKAKRSQVHLLIDECIDIADDTSQDTIIRQNKDGSESEICNSEYVNRSRLRIDTRKWMAARLEPTIYGEKMDSNHHVTLEETTRKVRDADSKYEY